MENNNTETPYLLKQPVFRDNRGLFAPIKLNDNWTQSNIIVNNSIYTFRGMHLQSFPKQQSKLLFVIQGRIVDIIIDLRKDSKTYKKVDSFVLEEGDGLYIPKGYAHGFLTLTPNSIVNYLVDEEYLPKNEINILWSSIPEVKSIIDRFCFNNIDNDVVFSDKDKQGINLNEIL
jgi:dTDP-4-dehydrorhamnose 3,5-epimerase